MKCIFAIIVLTLFFSTQTFSQERNSKVVFPQKPNQENNLPRVNDIDAENSRAIINQSSLDNGFLLVEEITQSWEPILVDWINSYKDSYTYDGNNNKIEYLKQFSNNNGSTWQNNAKFSYTYDVNNNLIQSLEQYWNNSTWRITSRELYTYDGNNNQIERLNQGWDGSVWLNSQKYSLTYDGNNNLIEYIYQKWNNSAWDNKEKYSYTYDGNNNQTEILFQTWYGGIAWANSQKTVYTYNTNNNVTEEKIQYWSNTGGTYSWKDSSKRTYTYDENNNLIESFGQTWDGSAWVILIRYSYTYDGNNNLIEELLQLGGVSSWWNSQKYSYMYDGNNNITEFLSQEWDVQSSVWLNQSKVLYLYTTETAINQTYYITSYDLSNNYPNPFNPSTKITYTIPERSNVSLKVFDLLGSEVVELVNGELAAGTYEINFNALQLSSGIYFYTLKAGPFIQTRKMILLK